MALVSDVVRAVEVIVGVMVVVMVAVTAGARVAVIVFVGILRSSSVAAALSISEY